MDQSEEPPTGSGVRAFPLVGGRSDCGPEIAPYFACPAWATPFAELGRPVTAPVLARGESTLFVGTDAGKVVALAREDGELLWSADVGGVPSDDPALAEGVLYVPRQDWRLAALPVTRCPEDCAVAWTAALGSPAGQPAVAGGAVVVGTEGGRVAAFDAAGCGRRRCPALWRDDVGAAVTGDPAISGGRVLVGTADGRLVAYAPAPASA